MASSLRDTVFTYIGANVRAQRMAKGLTQEQVAETVDLAVRYIQQIEHGEVNPTVGVVVDLAQCLDVAPWTLLQPAKMEPRKKGRPAQVKTKAVRKKA